MEDSKLFSTAAMRGSLNLEGFLRVVVDGHPVLWMPKIASLANDVSAHDTNRASTDEATLPRIKECCYWMSESPS